jgi:antitoxin ChpS
MATAKLRKVGGSLMVAIPPQLAEELRVSAQSSVDISVEDGALVLRPARRRYGLADLLAQCEPGELISDEDREWLGAPAIGREV